MKGHVAGGGDDSMEGMDDSAEDDGRAGAFAAALRARTPSSAIPPDCARTLAL